MNKIRSNIGLNKQSTKSNSTKPIGQAVINNSTISSSISTSNCAVTFTSSQQQLFIKQQLQQKMDIVQAKKKRTALKNISNATSVKEEEAKKSRLAPASFLPFGKKDSSLAAKKTVADQEPRVQPTVLHHDISLIDDTTDDDGAHEIIMTPDLVDGWVDIDKNDVDEEFNVPFYVVQIFKYYRERERKFEIDDYMKRQPSLNKNMRLLLIDWIVEVQQQLEFNHEVLYLSVKLLDLYLNAKQIEKEKLQLLGGAAMFIACKYEERIPPVIDDFIFVSDNAYDRNELMRMEIDILKTVGFDIGAPLSYTYLRRYAKCLGVDMKFLTLARYILELSLQEYTLSYVSESLKACAALYLALNMTMNDNKANGKDVKTGLAYTDWSATLIHYTDAFLKDFIDYVPVMNALVKNAPNAKYKTIFKKYSHPVFYEAAKIEPLSESDIQALKEQQ